MSSVLYDPENWLVSATRALEDYIKDNMAPRPVKVKIGMPDPAMFAEETPPEVVIIHLDTDDIDHPVLGFGTPGVEEYTPGPGGVGGDWQLSEAQVHLINFDIGVWVSGLAGGATARMQVVQKLSDLFSRPEGKKAMMAATEGLWVQSFSGGRFALDRVNDLPVWRAIDMTLVLRVVSRHMGPVEVVPEGFDSVPELTILDDNGNQVPIS